MCLESHLFDGLINLAFFNIDLACFNVDLYLKTDVLTSMPAALPALWPPDASLN